MVIETENLTKLYGDKVGCVEICLSVAEGQVFGFLGPNGAGKSTLVKMLVGLIYPTTGRARILGQPLGSMEARRRIGFLPENFRYQDWLTGYQLLMFHHALYGLPKGEAKNRITEVLDLVGLTDRAGNRVKTYSRGMQQRIGLACALLPDPDLLFLDEPTSALDPIGRKEVREIIFSLKNLGKTVFLNSHLLSEVEQVCDTVAVINKGRIVTVRDVAGIKSGSRLEVVLAEITPAVTDALMKNGKVFAVDGSTLIITLTADDEIPHIAEIVVNSGGRLFRLSKHTNSLEDTFLQILQEGGGPQC